MYPVQEQMSLGLGDAPRPPTNESSLFLHKLSSVVNPGQSATTLLSAFDSTSLLMGPSCQVGDQYNDQGFGNSTNVDWSTLQGPNVLQLEAQGNGPSDLWFNNILSSLPHNGLQSTNLALEAA